MTSNTPKTPADNSTLPGGAGARIHATAPDRPVVDGRGLDRDSPLPLYAQVKRRLHALINTGAFETGRFYTDQELCAMFGVSRFTVRQAIQELVAQGLLRRVQGQGTFVNTQKSEEVFGPKMDIPNQWARLGRPLRFELRRFGHAPCPPARAMQLGVALEQQVLHVERLRRDGDRVVSYDDRYIHPDFADSVREEDARDQSLLALLSREVKLARAENRVEAALAGDDVGALLEVPSTSAVMIRELLYFSDDGLPVMAGRSYYPGERIRHTFTIALDSGKDFGLTFATPEPVVAEPLDQE